jgi:hypothetical protein
LFSPLKNPVEREIFRCSRYSSRVHRSSRQARIPLWDLAYAQAWDLAYALPIRAATVTFSWYRAADQQGSGCYGERIGT